MYRYGKLFRSRNHVHLLSGHLVTKRNEQTMVEEIRDTVTTHSIFCNTGTFCTVGLGRGLWFPEVDSCGNDPSKSLHDRPIRRFLLQNVHKKV